MNKAGASVTFSPNFFVSSVYSSRFFYPFKIDYIPVSSSLSSYPL